MGVNPVNANGEIIYQERNQADFDSLQELITESAPQAGNVGGGSVGNNSAPQAASLVGGGFGAAGVGGGGRGGRRNLALGANRGPQDDFGVEANLAGEIQLRQGWYQ